MPAVSNKDLKHPTTVHEKVALAIVKHGPDLEEDIVRIIADRDKAKKANAWVQVHDQLTKLEADLKKIRRKPLGFDDDGKSVGESPWSKEQMDERNKLQNQITKRTHALIKALHKDKPEWDDVFQLATNKSDGKSESSGESKGEGKEETK